jgi:hypothetical protein
MYGLGKVNLKTKWPGRLETHKCSRKLISRIIHLDTRKIIISNTVKGIYCGKTGKLNRYV